MPGFDLTIIRMSFKQYQKEISAAINGGAADKLDLFCHDVISRMLPYADAADLSDLSESEIDLINNLRKSVKNYPVDWAAVGQWLDSLSTIDERIEDDSLELDDDLIEFLGAVESWRNFAETGNKDAVCWVSEYLMNILDSYFAEDVKLENWLLTPEIKIEFDRQIAFLQGKS